MGKSHKGDSGNKVSSSMERRPFGKPPGCNTSSGQAEIKSELFTKIGTRSALITARYEYIRPDATNSPPINDSPNNVPTTGSGSDCASLRIKQVTINEFPSEVIYDIPRFVSKSVSNNKQ